MVTRVSPPEGREWVIPRHVIAIDGSGMRVPLHHGRGIFNPVSASIVRIMPIFLEGEHNECLVFKSVADVPHELFASSVVLYDDPLVRRRYSGSPSRTREQVPPYLSEFLYSISVGKEAKEHVRACAQAISSEIFKQFGTLLECGKPPLGLRPILRRIDDGGFEPSPTPLPKMYPSSRRHALWQERCE